MVEQTSITAADFFWNAAAQDAGFSGEFWVEAYQRYLDAVEQDPSRSLEERWHTPRTVRVPFRQGHVEVLIRTQPDGREYCALRFTAFPAGDGPEPRQLGRWYWHQGDGQETRPVLGEAVLPDAVNRW